MRFMTPGTIHQMRAATDVLVLEARPPEVEDVVRLEDSTGGSVSLWPAQLLMGAASELSEALEQATFGARMPGDGFACGADTLRRDALNRGVCRARCGSSPLSNR